MKAEAKSLRFLGESPQKLSVPFFQRGYVWNEDNWKELLENLVDENIKPFLGSIIIKNMNVQNPTEAQIIDGQQRLTSLTLLSKAIYDTLLLERKNLKGWEDDPDDNDIEDSFGKSQLKEFLFYRINSADSFKKAKVKIEHSKVDREAYETIIKENFHTQAYYSDNLDLIDMESESVSLILKCYKFFRLQLMQMTYQDIIDLFNNMYNDSKKMIVLISMESDDNNEQCIFDTINRAGVRLSVADIIKNELFKKCLDMCKNENEEQNIIRLYENNWEKIFYIYGDNEKHVWDDIRIFGNQQRTNLEFLLYCVAAIKWGKQDDIFSDLANLYKRETDKMNKSELINLVVEIHKYAKIFRDNIIKFQYDYKKEDDPMLFSYNNYIRRLLLILEVFGVQMFYPYILKMLANKDTISSNELEHNFKILESFIIRRRLASGSVSDYAAKCDYLIKNGTDEILYELHRDESRISNQEIMLYLKHIKLETAKIILFIIELYNIRDEKNDVDKLVYRYSLEHIMPKKWTNKWLTVPLVKKDGTKYQNEDGSYIEITSEKGQQIRNEHIGYIGNMTLLTQNLNSSIKNNTFEKKINGEGNKKPGYRQYTSLTITQELVKEYDNGNNIWNENKIEERTERIEKKILEIWPDFSDEN